MMSCSWSPDCVASWAAGVAVNLLFWGAIALPYEAGKWPIALMLSIIYADGLFWYTRLQAGLLETAGQENETGSNEERPERIPGDSSGAGSDSNVDNLASPEATGREDNDDSKRFQTIPVYLSLLYGLLALSVGVPGAIIATKVFPCDFNPDGWHNPQNADKRKPTWKTDVSLLPEAVQQWYNAHDPYSYGLAMYSDGQSVAQIDNDDGTATVYFSGTLRNSSEQELLVMSSGSGPRRVGSYEDPGWVTAVSNRYVCFRANAAAAAAAAAAGDQNNSVTRQFMARQLIIYCGDEASGFQSPGPFKIGVFPVNFAAIDGLLWFQKSYMMGVVHMDGVVPEQANGYAIVSVDPANILGNMTIHSTLEKPEYQPDSGICGSGEVILSLSSSAAACFLSLVALPMALFSVWLWYQKAIPSSSVTLFFSGALLLGSLMSFGDTYGGGFQSGFTMWINFATPVWLFICSYVLTVTTRLARAPLEWSVYASSVVIFACAINTIYQIDSDVLEYWDLDTGIVLPTTIVLLLFVFVPLSCIGIIVGSLCVFLLGTLGVTLDITNATYMMLRNRPLGVTAVVIALECLVILAATVRVCQARSRLQKGMVEGLKKCTKYVCGTRSYDSTEMELAESLLPAESQDGADNNTSIGINL